MTDQVDGPLPDDPVDDVDPPPISFWIMIGLFALYMLWRLIQGVVWVFERFS